LSKNLNVVATLERTLCKIAGGCVKTLTSLERIHVHGVTRVWISGGDLRMELLEVGGVVENRCGGLVERRTLLGGEEILSERGTPTKELGYLHWGLGF
jgi:hypothetical protein